MPALHWPAEGRKAAARQHKASVHIQGVPYRSRCRVEPTAQTTMSDKFESLDANEKAALESTLYRCRALVGRIGEELRKKKPEHFVDERSLADLHASLEHAAWVLEQKTAKG
jgi:hypothetical protein